MPTQTPIRIPPELVTSDEAHDRLIERILNLANFAWDNAQYTALEAFVLAMEATDADGGFGEG